MSITKTIYSVALLLSAEFASAAIVADGIWTGHDWYDNANKTGVKNGVPYSKDAVRQRALTSPLSLDGSIDDYMGMENV